VFVRVLQPVVCCVEAWQARLGGTGGWLQQERSSQSGEPRCYCVLWRFVLCAGCVQGLARVRVCGGLLAQRMLSMRVPERTFAAVAVFEAAQHALSTPLSRAAGGIVCTLLCALHCMIRV
jgi:hypothetical protein